MNREPEFNARDVIMVSHGEKTLHDSSPDDTGAAHYIVLSYNRPRMLQECLDSIVAQDYANLTVHVIDDGSDFDVENLCDKLDYKSLVLYQFGQMDPEERVSSSRIGANINYVVSKLPQDDIVFYLCDDDIAAPHWVSRCMKAFSAFPSYHVVQGKVYSFNDGQDWTKDSQEGMLGYDSFGVPNTYWSTGSFAHKAYCSTEENCKWHDNSLGHSQDDTFISDIWDIHKDYLMIDVPSMYRREHKSTLSNKLGRIEDGKYKVNFVPGTLDLEQIKGMMED